MTDRAGPSRPIRRLVFDGTARPDTSLEWLVTNGLGGYASGLVGGGLTRRYHGLLIAALPAPLGRVLYFTHLRVSLVAAGDAWLIDHENPEALTADVVMPLREFRLEAGLPVWTYAHAGLTVEKRLVMPAGENTVEVRFRLDGASRATLRLAPLFHVRPHDGSVARAGASAPPEVRTDGSSAIVEAAKNWPALQWRVSGAPARTVFGPLVEVPLEYAAERERGYDFLGSLWTPGWIDVELSPDAPEVAFVASTEPRPYVEAAPGADRFDAERRRRDALLARVRPVDTIAAELALAADQFLVTPASRSQEIAAARAAGEEVRSVIAGYHWFTDWGRDTMISLEGLALETGRGPEARSILRTFAHHIRDGLIPNLFPEGERHGRYHTADATLWFFHAVERYAARTGDQSLVVELLPAFVDIAEHHLAGTHFGIRVDPADGLLIQGAEHYQLTWMDAKVDDWVVTPRRGKAVEINALWFNALSALVGWLEGEGRSDEAAPYRIAAARASEAFNHRFWNALTGHLYDVVDGEGGDDPACRPNQLFAIALPHPVLAPHHWAAVLEVVARTLLTPVGLRSLAPGHPQYQPKYFGDLRARDAAYHQGTVWAWLIGPYIDAWLRLHPTGQAEARRQIEGFLPHLDAACVGSVSEIFDADAPFTPRGCIAQAWSVAELLRAWNRTAGPSPGNR